MLFLFIILLTGVESHVNYKNNISTTERSKDEPKVILVQAGNYSLSFVPLLSLLINSIPKFVNKFRGNGRSIDPEVPSEFEGINPCLDSILIRKNYPGSDCHFYQCELSQPVKPACAIQAIKDESSLIKIESSTVSKNSIIVKITNCLSIRIYKCSFGYVYSHEKHICVRFLKNYNLLVCPS